MNFQEELIKSLKSHNNRVAIENGKSVIPYSQLLDKANRVTSFLLNLDLGKETLIGIDLSDKPAIIYSMIGVVNARCAFVLLDGTLPNDRLTSMVGDMELTHVISSSDSHSNLESSQHETLNTYRLEDILASNEAEMVEGITYPKYDGDDSLYVYFTSGSTGTPKGIIGRNGSLLQFVQWETEAFDIDHNSRFSQFISPYFDAFLRDVFVPLFSGGTICIPPDDEDFFSPDNLISWIDESRISLIHCVPSLFRIFNADSLSPNHFKYLQYVLMSGEKINPPELVNWYKVFDDRIQLVNLYGTTETTMVRSCHKISPDDVKRNRIPIGSPIKGTELLILNKNLKPCNPLIPDELYIVSDYVTKGYLKDLELTNKKFLKIRKGMPNETIAFKTGDIARKLPGGVIELLGREDRQVKLRGIRVELDEVEAILMKSGLLKNALAIAHTDENENQSLITFIIKKEGLENKGNIEESIQQYCESHFPKHIAPSNIVEVNEYPLLSNGKIDYNALLECLPDEKGNSTTDESNRRKTTVYLEGNFRG